MAIYGGADHKYKPTEQRIDTRLTGAKLSENWQSAEGGWFLILILLGNWVLSLTMPILPLISSIVSKVLSVMFLNQHEKLQDVAYRMPEHIEGFDGSEIMPDKYFGFKPNRKFYKGKGVTYYGRDLKNNEQVWATDDDDRTHTNIFGATGSGKTELIHTMMVSQLVRNSGAIVVDAKGDIVLYQRTCNLARRFGRDADVFCITFAIGQDERGTAPANKPTNTFNLMLNTTSGMLVELLSGLLDGDGGSDDMWKSRAIAFIGAVTQPLVFLRDRQEIELSPATYIDYMELPEVERFVYESNYQYDGWEDIIKPLRSYLMTLPGYNTNKIGNQAQQTNEQFGYITMQMTRSINDLGFTYGHIFGTSVGEIDISDVVLNRRILVILLPSLQRSLPTLMMLARLILASIKQMMASSLGSKIEGNIRVNIESRPTTANNCFRIILDEVGYMMTTGMSILPAQARSLNIAMVFAAQDYTDIERGSSEEAQAIWSNATIKFVGKLTSGEESEMWRRTRGMAGEIEQAVIGHYDRSFTMTYDMRYRAGGTVNKERRSLVNYQDIAGQVKGEFTLIAPKKYQGGRTAGMAVVHLLCLFTGGLPEGEDMYVNDFIPMSTSKIETPDFDDLHERIRGYLKEGRLSQEFNDAVKNIQSEAKSKKTTSKNDLSLLSLEIQNACEVQQSHGTFVNILLELSLNGLAGVLKGFESTEYKEGKNYIASKANPSEEEISTARDAKVIANLGRATMQEFNKDPEQQQQHLRDANQEPLPEHTKEDIKAIHDTGIAVDVNRDTHIKEQIDEFNQGTDAPLDILYEDDFIDNSNENSSDESEREQTQEILINYSNHHVQPFADSARAKMLINAVSKVGYITPAKLTDEIHKELSDKLNSNLEEILSSDDEYD